MDSLPFIIFAYLFFLGVCVLACINLKISANGLGIWRLKPSLLFVFSFALYTSAMPMSRVLHLSDVTAGDAEFLMTHILAALGILSGVLVARTIYTTAVPGDPKILKHRLWLILALATITGGFLLWRSIYFVGSNPLNLLERYRFEQDLFESQGMTLDKLSVHLTSACCTFGFISIATSARERNPARIVLGIVLTCTALILLARGNRNPLILVLLPIIGVWFRKRSFPLMSTLVAIAIIYIFFQTVAIVRNYGLLNIANADIQPEYYDPLRSELGTTYKVYIACKDTPFFEERYLGKTYTYSTLVNLVPTFIWPNRPPTLAGELSFYHFEKGGLEVFGLGYSPVLEAQQNFSVHGILPTFILLTIGLMGLEQWLERKGAWGVCSWAALLPIVINLQRIDFAVAVKIYLIFVAIFWLLDKISCTYSHGLQVRLVKTKFA